MPRDDLLHERYNIFMSGNEQTLHITKLWDGKPALESEHASLVVRLTAEHLIVSIDAPFHGDPAPGASPGPTPGLWNHEVVELFICGPDAQYTEVEIGPHGHHLVLQLSGVRSPTATCLPLQLCVTKEENRWTASAALDAGLLPPRPWTVNAYAIHGEGAARRYLACYPAPGDAPDFHRLEAFQPIELEP